MCQVRLQMLREAFKMARFRRLFLKFSLLFNHIGRTKPFQWEDIYKGQLLAKHQHDPI